MKYIGRMTNSLFLVSLFIAAINLYGYLYIGPIQKFKSSIMNMKDCGIGAQQLQDAFYARAYSVYYLWCTKKSFEFRNYLSVTSVIKHMDPDKVVLFYKDYPVVDPRIYNVWLDEILQKYPYLETVKVPDTVCKTNDSSTQNFVSAYLKGFEGIQWEEHTMLTSQLTKTDASDVITNRKKFFARCSSASSVKGEASLPLCIVLDRSFYPKDIWNLDTPFGRSTRRLFYGVDEIRNLVPSYCQLAPNIAHIMWVGGGEMDFLFYLSILSLIHVAEVDKVFIYGEAPTGFYWSLLQNNSKVKVVRHALVERIYGKPIKSLVHMGDILRVEILKRYGGIYLDTDAVVVKPFQREIRAYDAVVSLDGMASMFLPFPDVINNGVMIGKKYAKFWDIFQESMKDFIDDDYTYNGVRRSYQILERHPDVIHVDPRLQVICYLRQCHPTWWPGYHNSSLHHLSSNIKFDWKNDAYVIHWTTSPAELLDPKLLLNSTGMFAEIGKYILEKSNMTQYFCNSTKT